MVQHTSTKLHGHVVQRAAPTEIDGETSKIDNNSYITLTLWRVVFLALPLFCFIYFATMWWGYWNLPGTSMAVLLRPWLGHG